jgi:agmatine deiminase
MRIYPTLIGIFLPFLLIGQNADRRQSPFVQEQVQGVLPVAEIIRDENPPAFRINKPPSLPVRAMAEWEELQSLLITWRAHPAILTEIVRAAQSEVKVVICCENQTVVNNARNYLKNRGVNADWNIEFVTMQTNSIWIRDYGPNCVYANDVDSLYFIDWIYNRARPNDDAIPIGLSNYFNIPLYATILAPFDLVNTGGNFMSDGMGTGFSSELVLRENGDLNIFGQTKHGEDEVDEIIYDFMGIERYIKMNTLLFDGIHHMDMHMKLLDEETLLVGQYPPGVADGPQIEANLQYILQQFQTPFGTPYKVVRIPMPPDRDGQYPDAKGDFRTYTNAVFVNKTLIVPTYEARYDSVALRIWRAALPGYRVIGVDCNDIISSFGAVHCITKEVGVPEPLRIVHQPIARAINNPKNPERSYPVEALIQHRSGIASAQVYFTTDTLQEWQSVTLYRSAGQDSLEYWKGFIPAQETGSIVYYYIESVAKNGKTQVRPMPAPKGYWKFRVQPPTSVHTPGKIRVEDPYPNPAGARTVIPVQTEHRTEVVVYLSNAMGQTVQTIYKGELPEGQSNYFFDAGSITPGMYFIYLQTEDGARFAKKVLIK